MFSFSISGNLVDVHQKKIYPAEIKVEDGKIVAIIQESKVKSQNYLLPGFIDSHVHIESSMLVPSEFAKLAVIHGTVATVSDPHEIANVCGMKGVEFMIANGKTVPFKFNFGAPSCVPATGFETAGATLNSDDVEKLLQREEIKYLSEMMNFPGVLNEDKEVMKKIAAAHKLLKPVDGHAPGLRGEDAKNYIAAGITTDHECFTKDEALGKLQNGMKIIIREGSAAKNFEALIDLLHDYPNQIMFCSDDKHPDSLVLGHINQLCARAVAKGINVYKVLRAACVNPVLHYKLDVGLLKKGDAADFIVVKDLEKFEVVKTYINGELVAEERKSKIKTGKSEVINNFKFLKGAIASSVAHDSHNIVAVGVDDESICRAVNLVIENKGGVSAVDNENETVLALPVAGLMSNEDGYKVAASYTAIDKIVKEKLGSTLSAPFMTLSFMALLVIPHLKLSDKGLFDGDKFQFIS